MASPGLRQRLVQREAAGTGPRDGAQVSGLAPGQLAGAGRLREGRAQVGAVEITGRVDRLERDADGRAVVVDLKTSSAPVAGTDLDRHPQLGVYQLAVMLGAFEQLGLTEPGGAELIQVGKASLAAQVRVQPQRALADDPEPGWARELAATLAAGMAGPLFEGRLNPSCRQRPGGPPRAVHAPGEGRST